MTKSVLSQGSELTVPTRQPRPFLFLEPRGATCQVTFDAGEVDELERRATDDVPALVRSLVDYTIALQNRRALEYGRGQPIQVSVLNRRRRAARAWMLAILAGKVGAATRHAVATQWLPTLCVSGLDPVRCGGRAAQLIEFVRGAITACIFDRPADNLVPPARALHVLEQTLAVHLSAVREAARAASPTTTA